MMEGGHYAASHIRSVASRLDRAWKEFAAGLDERTAVLALSVLFHHKAEQVIFSLQILKKKNLFLIYFFYNIFYFIYSFFKISVR